MVTPVDEWAKRVGVNPEDYTSIRDFQAAMRSASRTHTEGSLSMTQMNTLSQYYRDTVRGGEIFGVQKIEYNYGQNTYFRYIIPGISGFWTYESLKLWLEHQITS